MSDISSSSRPLKHGVPQGSVLGPLRFSLYFARVEDVILAHDLDWMIYADDIQLYVTINSLQDQATVLAKLGRCIKDIITWYSVNGLECNPKKTDWLFIYHPGLSSVILWASLDNGADLFD